MNGALGTRAGSPDPLAACRRRPVPSHECSRPRRPQR